MAAKTPGDQLFEQYLHASGYTWAYEPDWAAELGVETDKVPDYLIQEGQLRAICEVKQFTTTRITDRLAVQRTAMLSEAEVFGAVRNAVRNAARTLRPFAECDLPLVIVLTNPLGADVHLDPEHVIHAALGNPQVGFTLRTDTGEVVGPPRLEAGRDGVLARDHRYVSGVVVLHHPDGGVRADVHATGCEGEAVPLPGDMFDGQTDVCYGWLPGGLFGELPRPR